MLLEDNLSPWRLEELIGATKLLLDSSLALRMTDEELLDFTELDDAFVSFSSFDDEDFAFSLLDEFFCTLELEDFAELLLDCFASLAMTEEELFSFFDELLFSTLIGSSLASADADESSPHPTSANAAMNTAPIALRLQNDCTRNFFINPPAKKSKVNVIYFHP